MKPKDCEHYAYYDGGRCAHTNNSTGFCVKESHAQDDPPCPLDSEAWKPARFDCKVKVKASVLR